MPSRFGSPKLTFEAPQVELTFELVLQPPHEPQDLPSGLAHRADRHHERVDEMSSRGMP